MLRRLKHRWRSARARADVAARLRQPPAARPHGLSWPLIVSLTSHPARFPTLAPTLGALITQTVRADATVLWLAWGDEARLPPEVTALQARGLEIGLAEDLRSYKKIVPALAAHPGAAIVTADDDVFYPRDWLERLVASAAPGEVTCHRAHRMAVEDGLVRPYADWVRLRAPERGPLVFPTGVLGVLYPPGSLHEDATRVDLLTALAPTSDDVWLWWMHRMAGATARKVGGRSRVLEWPDGQAVSLRGENAAGAGNDRAVAAMVARYGLPLDA